MSTTERRLTPLYNSDPPLNPLLGGDFRRAIYRAPCGVWQASSCVPRWGVDRLFVFLSGASRNEESGWGRQDHSVTPRSRRRRWSLAVGSALVCPKCVHVDRERDSHVAVVRLLLRMTWCSAWILRCTVFRFAQNDKPDLLCRAEREICERRGVRHDGGNGGLRIFRRWRI